MDRYPVAGNIIGFKIIFGVTLRDALETVAVPATVLVLGDYLFPGQTLVLYLSAIGVFVGALILYLKNDNEYPHQYIGGLRDYYVGDNTYFNRRDRRDTDLGDEQEVIITQMDTEYGMESLAEEWRKNNER